MVGLTFSGQVFFWGYEAGGLDRHVLRCLPCDTRKARRPISNVGTSLG
jgi:hypothetical protein